MLYSHITCAVLLYYLCCNQQENAHFRICEALIEAFESMKFNRMMKRQETGKSKSSSGSSSDEEIRELRQRIRIRKREKMMAVST